MAGQLNYCLDHGDRFTAVLLGFNPSSMARYAYTHQPHFQSCVTGRDLSETGIRLFTMVNMFIFYNHKGLFKQ